MADNVPITAGSGTSIATDEISTVHYQRVKVAWGPDGTANDTDTAAGKPLPVLPICSFVTVTTDLTRTSDTSTYTALDAMSNSQSAPTAGGFTLTGAARISGGSGIITDACFTTSNDPTVKLSAEMWLFNQAVTAINDNSAFAVSDTDVKTVVGVIPFTMFDSGNNGFAQIVGLNMGFTCSGSADLRFLYRVRNAYVPASGEVITATLKIIQVN